VGNWFSADSPSNDESVAQWAGGLNWLGVTVIAALITGTLGTLAEG